MSSTFGINYSTHVASYHVGPTAAPAYRADHEQAAALDLTSALLEFDGVQQELEGLQRVEHLLEELRAADRRGNGDAGEGPGDEP